MTLSIEVKFEIGLDGRLLANGADMSISAMYPPDMRGPSLPMTPRVFRRDALRKSLFGSSIKLPRGVRLGGSWTQTLNLDVLAYDGDDLNGIDSIEYWFEDGDTPERAYADIDGYSVWSIPVDVEAAKKAWSAQREK